MKKICTIALALCSLPLRAQTATHSVTLNWQPATDGSDAGGTINVYRAIGACGSGGQQFALIKGGVGLSGPYVDTAVTAGIYCYYVTAVVNTEESDASNLIAAIIKPIPVIGLTVTVK
jgi:hypothetical protein